MKNNRELKELIGEEDIYENYVEFIQNQNKALITELNRCYGVLDQMQSWIHSLATGEENKKYPKHLNFAELLRDNELVGKSIRMMEQINSEKLGRKIAEEIKEIEA